MTVKYLLQLVKKRGWLKLSPISNTVCHIYDQITIHCRIQGVWLKLVKEGQELKRKMTKGSEIM